MAGALIHAGENFKEHRVLIEERLVALDSLPDETTIEPEVAKQVFNDGARAVIQFLAYNGYTLEAQTLSLDCNDAAWSGESVESVRKLALDGLNSIDPVLYEFWS